MGTERSSTTCDGVALTLLYVNLKNTKAVKSSRRFRHFPACCSLLLMTATADCSGKISREPRPQRREPNTRALPICAGLHGGGRGVHVPACGTEKREESDKDKSINQLKAAT